MITGHSGKEHTFAGRNLKFKINFNIKEPTKIFRRRMNNGRVCSDISA